jgi:nucleoside phosphorylase
MKATDIKGKVDFGIITMLDNEFSAVLRRFPPQEFAVGERTYTMSSVKTSASEACLVAMVRCVEAGEGGGQKTAEALINDLDPQWLVLVGIGGAPPDDDFTLGDVIVASRLHDFTVGAAKEKPPHEYDIAGGPMHPEIQDFLAQLPALDRELQGWNGIESIGMIQPLVELDRPDNFYGNDDWQKKVKETLTRNFGPSAKLRLPLYRCAPIGSSDLLIKDTQIMFDWRTVARHLGVVEMELAGVYRAARRMHREYPILAIRGISDIIGFRRDPGWNEYACHSAASLAYALIKTTPVVPRSQRHIEAKPDPEQGATQEHAMPDEYIKGYISLLDVVVEVATAAGDVSTTFMESRRQFDLARSKYSRLHDELPRLQHELESSLASCIAAFVSDEFKRYLDVMDRSLPTGGDSTLAPPLSFKDGFDLSRTTRSSWTTLRQDLLIHPVLGPALAQLYENATWCKLLGFETVDAYHEYVSPTTKTLFTSLSPLGSVVIKRLVNDGYIDHDVLEKQGIPASVSVEIANRLHRDHWATKTDWTTDLKGNRVSLTEAGRKLLRDAFDKWKRDSGKAKGVSGE